MADENFYDSPAAAELATAYQKQNEKDNQDLDLFILFILLFSGNTL